MKNPYPTSYPLKPSLAVQIAQHPAKHHHCPFCGMENTTWSYLNEHMFNWHGVKAKMCTTCFCVPLFDPNSNVCDRCQNAVKSAPVPPRMFQSNLPPPVHHHPRHVHHYRPAMNKQSISHPANPFQIVSVHTTDASIPRLSYPSAPVSPRAAKYLYNYPKPSAFLVKGELVE